jgi:hypothetical protein
LKLTECLPEIINVDFDTPDVDITNTNFQRFSCSIEAASKIYSHRVDSLHDLALYFHKSLISGDDDNNNNMRLTGEDASDLGEANQSTMTLNKLLRNRGKSKTIEEDEKLLNRPHKDGYRQPYDPLFLRLGEIIAGN